MDVVPTRESSFCDCYALVNTWHMKHYIKRFVQHIGRKKTEDVFLRHCTDITYNAKNKHVVIFVDNVKPMHELLQAKHDTYITKAIDRLYGENCTYEVKKSKNNVIHERSSHVMRYGSSTDVQKQ